MIKIVLAGRTDLEAYFKLSGVFGYETLPHTPFLAFVVTEATLQVQIVDSALKLLAFPDETQVMGQWRGDYRSDYFQFKVGQYRQYLDEKDAAFLKTVRNVVKHLGPQGGFRSLAYEYIGENGSITQTSTGSKAEAERLEALFLKNGIVVEIQKASRTY